MRHQRCSLTNTARFATSAVLLAAGAGLAACAVKGPPALDAVLSPSRAASYSAIIGDGGHAGERFLAWRAAARGQSLNQQQDDDAALSSTANPFDRDDAEAVALGAAVYQAHCLECHGPNADGYAADGTKLMGTKNFGHPHTRMAIDMSKGLPAEWFGKVWDGSATDKVMADGTPVAMPAFKDQLSREQVWLSLTYLMSDASIVEQAAEHRTPAEETEAGRVAVAEEAAR